MQKRRVLLVCSPHLFGESLQSVLRAAEDIEILGPSGLDEDICQKIPQVCPSAVVIAAEDPHSEAITGLTAAIIEKYPELSVIRTGLEENVFRVFSTHTLPARGTELLEAIRSLSDWKQQPGN